jgi:predicted nucleic acid-binding protein
MPPLVLVDSSLYITLLRRGQDPFICLHPFLEATEFATCPIIRVEVLRGRSDPRLREFYSHLLSRMVNLEASHAVWAEVERLAWELDREGNVLPLSDLIIAATALQNGAAVLTFDRHFQKVPGLVCLSELSS